nr:hypothetical protein [Prolinoborus fasciculus]
MSNSKDNRPKTLLEEALGVEPERVIEMPRSDVVEVNTSLECNSIPNISRQSSRKNPWNPARNVMPEKSYYDLQEVLDCFASRHGFDFGSIEGDKVVVYKERKK